MDTSTVMRNAAIMEDVLSGKDYSTCAKKYNISTPSVSNAIRSTLKLLKEYTDIDIVESASYNYLIENEDRIKKALASPFPKTTLTPSAKSYLKNKFGKYFAHEPGKIAAEWPIINNAFNRFTERRDIASMQDWLASEGFLVGNILTNTMLDFAWDTLQKGLCSIKTEQGESSFMIKKVDRTGWKNKLVMYADMEENGHKVTRQFSIELTPN